MSKLSNCYTIKDLRQLAIRKIPPVIFDYLDGGAEAELTLKRNESSFDDYEFVPRTLVDVSQIDLTTTFQGEKIDLPIVSAPTGMSRMFHHEGEKAVVKATHKMGTAYCLSTVSTYSIEEVAQESEGVNFFQIYAWHNKSMVADFIERCKKSKYKGLMLAVDLAALGKRERDLKNGHGRPALKKNIALGALKRPAWLYHFITKPTWRMANMIKHLPHGAETSKVVEDINNQFSPSVTWEDATQMMASWEGKFMLKGIQSVEDAIKAADMGVTGIVLSNHGGRQLDGAPSAMDILPEVVAAVGDSTEIIIDGGIRRGSDVIKALALGAKSCLIGRGYLYGLAAGGEAGVTRAYEIFKDDMIRTMKLIGCTSLNDLDGRYVRKKDKIK